VLKQGEMVELGAAEKVLSEPKHPYTQMLIGAVPSHEPPERPTIGDTAPVVMRTENLDKRYTTHGFFGRSVAVDAAADIDVLEEVAFASPDPGITEDGALRIARAFVVPEDFGTPAGAITLRGAYNFRTPTGWDTVYTPVLNMVDRPIAPAFVVRVETDWYAHQTEFRYVLQPGEGLPGSHNLPIGQVHFVPREAIELVECDEAEVEDPATRPARRCSTVCPDLAVLPLARAESWSVAGEPRHRC